MSGSTLTAIGERLYLYGGQVRLRSSMLVALGGGAKCTRTLVHGLKSLKGDGLKGDGDRD